MLNGNAHIARNQITSGGLLVCLIGIWESNSVPKSTLNLRCFVHYDSQYDTATITAIIIIIVADDRLLSLGSQQ